MSAKSLSWVSRGVVRVPANEGPWQLALDYVCASHLLRLRVVEADAKGVPVKKVWNLSKAVESTADGINTSARTGLLTPLARRGALIGKIGGSTADVPDASNAASPYGTGRKVFPVGSYCMVSVATGEAGPLFLAMNDSPDGIADHDGALHVSIEECSA